MRRASVGDAQAHGPAGLKINSYVRTSSQILTDDYTVYEDIVSYLKGKEEWSTSTPTGKTARAVAQRQISGCRRLRGCVVVEQIECDVNEHVFLSSDQTAPSGFHQERARIDIEAVGDRFGVAQEA